MVVGRQAEPCAESGLSRPETASREKGAEAGEAPPTGGDSLGRLSEPPLALLAHKAVQLFFVRVHFPLQPPQFTLHHLRTEEAPNGCHESGQLLRKLWVPFRRLGEVHQPLTDDVVKS